MTFVDKWGAIRARPRDPARPFHYQLSTEIVFGEGQIGAIGEHLKKHGVNRPLIVTDQGMRASGIIDRVEELLVKSGVPVEVFDSVTSDP
ncbi:MAG: iron-containing alcohol dehydrogenase, partial [Thermomicrobiales bacterium]